MDSHHTGTTRCHYAQCSMFVQRKSEATFDEIVCVTSANCPKESPFIELNGGCVAECAGKEVYVQYTDNGETYLKCQKSCSAGSFTYKNANISSNRLQCSQSCPADIPYISGSSCVESCAEYAKKNADGVYECVDASAIEAASVDVLGTFFYVRSSDPKK